MKEFYLWITVLTKQYEEKICAALLNMGYTVTSAAEHGKVNTDTYNSAALFAFKLSKNDATKTSIYNDISTILININAYYYSLIISETADALWLSTNITFEDPLPTIKEIKNKELN